MTHDYRRRMANAVAVIVTVFIIGVLGYRIVGGDEHSWMDAIYMTANVLTTVGFREAITVQGNPAAAVFTIVLLIFGAGGLVFATSIITAFIVEGDLTESFRSRRMQRAIRDMKGHYIVCGIGATGSAVIRELVNTKRPAVAMETNEDHLKRCQEMFPTVPVLKEDFTDDEALLHAGIERAAGIVICTQIDKDLLVTTITARQLNPRLRIVARAANDKIAERLRHAGADAVVSPALIGGMRMASELIRPSVVSFLDMMLRDTNRNLRVEEVFVPAASPFVGRTLGELNTHSRSNCLLLATRSMQGEYAYNPHDDVRLEAGTILIVMGTILIVMGDPEDVRQLTELCASASLSSAATGSALHVTETQPPAAARS